MLINGFLKISMDNFYQYMDNASPIIDLFYKKTNSNNSLNFSLNNHKIIITNSEFFINSIEIDHKNIFFNYNKKENLNKQTTYIFNILNEILKILKVDTNKLKINRIGHAIHYVIENNYEIILKKMFTSKEEIKNISNVVFNMKVDNDIFINKILDTPIDNNNQTVLLLNIDYFKNNIKFSEILKFLNDSKDYFSKEENILRGIYE
jgi:hypothetical protein